LRAGEKAGIRRGPLDLLVLKTLDTPGALQRHGVAQRIRQDTGTRRSSVTRSVRRPDLDLSQAGRRFRA
jgi:hypothetical protein